MRRLALLGIAVVSLSLLTVPAANAAVSPAAAAAAPTAAQLLAKTNSCTVASASKYKTDDDVASSTINICKSGTAYFWKADMDVDCDGVASSVCNSSTDPWYQGQTSFTTSTGRYFTASTTHYYVIPLPSSRFSYTSAGIKPGTVAAVIYNNKIVYAVFADEGPNNIIGEASYATARDLGIDPNPETGGTDSGVTYIVFKGNVPSPVENNSTITTKGQAAAAAWLAG
jgi:glycosyl hydrolase group 75 (putative chitosanase)